MNTACIQARVILCALIASGIGGGASDSGASNQAAVSQFGAVNSDWGALEWSAEPRIERLRVTAYCDRGLTASGIRSGIGQCAAPDWVPFGSIVFIPEIDRALIVTDRTARRFRGNTVDIFMPDYATCRKFGRQFLDCTITPPLIRPQYGAPELEQAVRYLRSATLVSQSIRDSSAARQSPAALDSLQVAQSWGPRDNLSRWMQQLNPTGSVK